MAFFINKQPDWLVKALGRAPKEDSGPPNFIPDTISPTVDTFGWDRYGGVQYDTSVGAASAVQVFPDIISGEWIGAGVVPELVVRLIYNCHVEHDDDTNRQCWLVMRDRSTGTEIKVATDTAGLLQPKFFPTAITRPFLLRPRELMIGRCQTITAGKKLTMRYSWIDFNPGEYFPYLA